MTLLKKPRSFQVQIITIFVFLISISSIAIVSVTHYEQYQSILKFSQQTIEQVGTLVLQRVQAITEEENNLVRMVAGLMPESGSLSFSNTQRQKVLLNACRYHKIIEAIYFGFSNGGFFGAFNLKIAGQTHYLSDSTKPLPPDTTFAFKIIDPTIQPLQETWEYRDENLNLLDQETIPTTFDSTKRPWYLKAIEDPKNTVWTNIYQYLPLENLGITVAQAVMGKNNQIAGVAGVDLSLNFLTPFLETQEISKAGKAMILNPEGMILVPPEDVKNVELKKIAQVVTALLKKSPAEDLLFKIDGETYLASIDQCPISNGNQWIIVVTAPLKDFFEDLINTEYEVLMISIAIIILSLILVIYFSKKVSNPIVLLAKETDRIKHFDFTSRVQIQSNIKEITLMEVSISSMKAAIHSFSRYIPKEVVSQLIKLGQEITLGGDKKNIVVFFSDINGFSKISNSFPADQVTDLLAQYFDGLSRIILDYGGTIDKYTGDGIMAFWNAPVPKADYIEASCLAAIECQFFVKEFNTLRKKEGFPEFSTRIGLNIGDAIVGNIGTMERMNYTALGDTVNIASRLEQLNKAYGTKIMIRKNLYEKIGKNYVVRPLDSVILRGISEETEVYELIGLKQGKPSLAATADEITLATLFTEAYKLEKQNQSDLARKKFQEIAQKFPLDLPTRLHLGAVKK